jgi:hypothetical protein
MSAQRVSCRAPTRAASQGMKGAISSTPQACMPAFKPMKVSEYPRASRSSAIRDADRL